MGVGGYYFTYRVSCFVNNVDVEEVDLVFEDGLQGCVN